MIPFRTKNPPESTPWATYTIMGLNIALFAVLQRNLQLPEEAVEQFGMSRNNLGVGTFFSSMFMHGDIFHLLGNMLFLGIFGRAVEGRLKTPKFLLLYFVSGFLADAAHFLLLSPKLTMMPSIGASGAIMGVLGAAIFMFPFAPVVFFWITFFRLMEGEFTVEWPLWAAGAYYIVWDIFGAILNFAGVGGTAHVAHLGGLFGAMGICALLRVKRDDAYVAEAKKSLAESGDYTSLWKVELEEIVKAQPDNYKAAVALLYRAYREGGVAKPEHLAGFKKSLRPALADESLTTVMTQVSVDLMLKNPNTLSVPEWLTMAKNFEQRHNPNAARTVLEGLRKVTGHSDSDSEALLHQLAKLYDQWFRQPEATYALYYEFYQKYPMSPLAPSVVERMKQMYPEVQAAAAARMQQSGQQPY